MNVTVYRPPIDLGRLWLYRSLRKATRREQASFKALTAHVYSVAETLAKELEHETNQVNDLRRQLRLLTRGTPLTEALTARDHSPLLRSDPKFSQQQHDAQTFMLKVVWRKLCALYHPDKGGDKEIFDEVQDAYTQRDLPHLNDLYLHATAGHNLYWQQSDDGLYHASTEYERPKTKLQVLRQTLPFKVAAAFTQGHKLEALLLLQKHLQLEAIALLNEINYITAKGAQHG